MHVAGELSCLLRLSLIDSGAFIRQVHSLLPSKSLQDSGSCRKNNFEYGCEGSECAFSVGWRREAEAQLVVELTALLPEQKDVWAAVTVAEKVSHSALTPLDFTMTTAFTVSVRIFHTGCFRVPVEW